MKNAISDHKKRYRKITTQERQRQRENDDRERERVRDREEREREREIERENRESERKERERERDRECERVRDKIRDQQHNEIMQTICMLFGQYSRDSATSVNTPHATTPDGMVNTQQMSPAEQLLHNFVSRDCLIDEIIVSESCSPVHPVHVSTVEQEKEILSAPALTEQSPAPTTARQISTSNIDLVDNFDDLLLEALNYDIVLGEQESDDAGASAPLECSDTVDIVAPVLEFAVTPQSPMTGSTIESVGTSAPLECIDTVDIAIDVVPVAPVLESAGTAHSPMTDSTIEYKLQPGMRIGSQLLYTVVEKQLYRRKTQTAKYERYSCIGDKGCRVTILVSKADGMARMANTHRQHNHQHQEEKAIRDVFMDKLKKSVAASNGFEDPMSLYMRHCEE